jgi:acetolactate synthase small subunit
MHTMEIKYHNILQRTSLFNIFICDVDLSNIILQITHKVLMFQLFIELLCLSFLHNHKLAMCHDKVNCEESKW